MWQEYPFLSDIDTQAKPCIGISACLSGENVRYDGQAKLQSELLSYLTPLITLKPLCPEVAIGMGVPRSPIQLSLKDNVIDAVYADDRDDSFSTALSRYAEDVIGQDSLAMAGNGKICGFVFKSRSPSCGAGSTPIYSEGIHIRFGDGIFAHRIRCRLPWIPIMDEEELVHPHARERFIFFVYLLNDFYRSLKYEGGAQAFFEHHSPLIKELQKTIKTEMESYLLRCHKREDPAAALDRYLTPFIHCLEERSYQELSAIISRAC